MLKDVVLKNRSYRRFYQDVRIPRETLKELVDCARLTPSTANLQALKYMLISEEDECEKVFATLGWAGYLKDWPGPAEEEKPSAYIIILKRPEFAEEFGVDTERYTIELCVALGKPKEKVVLTGIGEDGSVQYYRDPDGTHYVPKRTLKDIIIK